MKDSKAILSTASILEKIEDLFEELSLLAQNEALDYVESLYKKENLKPLLQGEKMPETGTDEYLFLTLSQAYKGNVVRKLYLEAGINKHLFEKFTVKYNLKKVSPGFYVFPNFPIDGPFMFQQKYSKAKLALESALDLMDYTDHFPNYTTMYMPNNYNFNQLLNADDGLIEIKKVSEHQTNELFIYFPDNEPIHLIKNTKPYIGERISLRKSAADNYLYVTNLEQTIVDIFKPQFHIEEEIKASALKRYLDEHNNNSITLQRIAAKEGILRILDKYLERKLD